MSIPEPFKNGYTVSLWPQQVDDLSAEDYGAIMESLLKAIKPATDEKVAIHGGELLQRLIKEGFWLADFLRKKGKYDEAIGYYGSLIKLVYDQATGELSDAKIWYLSKAFIDYVDCGRLSSRLPLLDQLQQTAAKDMTASINTHRNIEHLFETAEKGKVWLESIGKPGWAAGLLLEQALLLKSQGKSNEALCKMKEALQKKEGSKETPGYSLFTHKLELAELLYASVMGEKDEKLGEAANLVSAIPSDSKSTLNERRLACLMLAKIRQRQGEQDTANVELGKAQKFLYEMERTTIAEDSHQLLGSAYQDAGKIVKVVAEVDQTLQSVQNKAELLKNIAAAPIVASPVTPASSSEEAIPTRHISCYVSLPHSKKDGIFYQMVLLPALRKILECNPFYWQVGYRDDILDYQYRRCSDCPAANNKANRERDCWLKCADVYIAVIEGWSPDVLAELGIIYAMRMMRTETPPPIILYAKYANSDEQQEHDSVKESIADHLSGLGTVFLIPDDFKKNPTLSDEQYIKLSLDQIWRYLRDDIFVKQGFLELNKRPRNHYLSPVWIEEKCKYTDKNMTEAISREYTTMEAFKDAIKGTNERITTKRAKAAADKLSPWEVTQDVIRSILNAVLAVLEGNSE